MHKTINCKLNNKAIALRLSWPVCNFRMSSQNAKDYSVPKYIWHKSRYQNLTNKHYVAYHKLVLSFQNITCTVANNHEYMPRKNHILGSIFV